MHENDGTPILLQMVSCLNGGIHSQCFKSENNSIQHHRTHSHEPTPVRLERRPRAQWPLGTATAAESNTSWPGGGARDGGREVQRSHWGSAKHDPEIGFSEPEASEKREPSWVEESLLEEVGPGSCSDAVLTILKHVLTKCH